jgi:hypothetical protein
MPDPTKAFSLADARAGCKVRTHAGGELTIDTIDTSTGNVFYIQFAGYRGILLYGRDGRPLNSAVPHPMDIVSITPPPLTDAERLEKIASIASSFYPTCGPLHRGVPVSALDEILALAKREAG